jgi:putative transposase
MSQKLQFIEKASARGANVSALCREYGISRQTGHKWLRRYREHGYVGLVEQSRRPRSSPLTTGEEIVVSILELRDRRSTWGPDKIARVLERKFGEAPPARARWRASFCGSVRPGGGGHGSGSGPSTAGLTSR